MNSPNLIHSAKKIIKKEIYHPIVSDYLPPEHEKRWGTTRNAKLSNIFSPLRKWRDKRKFIQNLTNKDLFIVGHPKSGNTWIAYMTAILVFNDLSRQINLANIGSYAPVIHGRDSHIRKYGNNGNTRVFRNEWPVYPEQYPKTIYLVRDPRAVLASYYQMYLTYFAKENVSLKDFIEEYLSEGYIKSWEPLMRWDKQVLYWINRSKKDNRVLIVKYEDTVSDRKATIIRIARFAGIDFTEALLDSVVDRGSFSAMRADEDQHGAESYPGKIGERGKFIRKGKIDGWKEEMTSDIIMRIEGELSSEMKNFGYL